MNLSLSRYNGLEAWKTSKPQNSRPLFDVELYLTVHKSFVSTSLRGNFFQCHVFAMKSVQNLKYFWRSSQNYFVLALFCSL
jgi:hypothetical protein